MLNDDSSASHGRRPTAKTVALFILKSAISAACLAYIVHQIDFSTFVGSAANIDFRWVACTVTLLMLGIPLGGLRWAAVTETISGIAPPLGKMIAIIAIAMFFTQVLPLAGDAIRISAMTLLGPRWRLAITSVVVDRGVGVFSLLAIAVVALLLPSALAALGGYRDLALGFFCALLVAGFAGVVLARYMIDRVTRWQPIHEIARIAIAFGRVMEPPAGVRIFGVASITHAFTILSIWCLGRAQGLDLLLADATVLFVLMVGLTLLPISIGGWGLRELAVVTLLGDYGVPVEQALFFSVCFGLSLVAASLPGAIVAMCYAPVPR